MNEMGKADVGIFATAGRAVTKDDEDDNMTKYI